MAACSKHDEAADAFDRAAALRPGVLDLRLRQAGALVSAGKAAAARDLLRETAELHAKEPRVLYLLAEVERSLQDYDGAEATARKLIALAPKQPFGPHALAQVYAQRHNYKGVIDDVDAGRETASISPPRTRGRTRRSGCRSATRIRSWAISTRRSPRSNARSARAATMRRIDAYLVQAYLAAGRTAKAVELAAGRARQAAEEPAPDESRSAGAPAARRFGEGDRASSSRR